MLKKSLSLLALGVFAGFMLSRLFSRINSDALITRPQEVINSGNADNTSLLSDGPFVFWEGELRAHVVAICNGKVAIKSYDVWQRITVASPCPTLVNELLLDTTDSTNNNAEYLHAERILLISGLAGELGRLQRILLREGVLDDKHQWAWQSGHMVILGGVFNADSSDTKSLWFLNQLAMQAKITGGSVDLLLDDGAAALMSGNTDLGYAKNAATLGLTVEDLFALNTEFGRWLRRQNTVLKINDMLFSNGVLGADFSAVDLDSINRSARMGLHTRFRLLSDPAVAKVLDKHGPLFAHNALNAADIDRVLQAFEVRQMISLNSAPFSALSSDKQWLLDKHFAIWRWQAGRWQELSEH